MRIGTRRARLVVATLCYTFYPSLSLSHSPQLLAFLASLQRPLERPHCLQQDSWTTLKLIYDLWRARLQGGCQFSFSSLKVSSISGTIALRIADLFWNSIWILATFENIDKKFLKTLYCHIKDNWFNSFIKINKSEIYFFIKLNNYLLKLFYKIWS